MHVLMQFVLSLNPSTHTTRVYIESEHLPDSPPPPPPQGIRHVILERPTLQTSFGFVLQSNTLRLGCRICECVCVFVSICICVCL